MDNLLDFTITNKGISKNQAKLDYSISFFMIQILTVIAVIFISISLVISLPINIAYGQQKSSSVNNSKLVILTFGDTLKGQITTAKPILDKYGFKASFFLLYVTG